MGERPANKILCTLFFSAQENGIFYLMQIYAGAVIRNLLKNSNIIEKPKTKFKFLQNSARPWRTSIFNFHYINVLIFSTPHTRI